MHIGLDFGTTNSGAAVFDGGRVRVLPLDPSSHNPAVMRSVLYVTREHDILVGREAVDTYYRQNIGRPSKLVRQRIGEVELTIGDVGSVKGYPVGPTTFVRDVYALVDELTPGRLLHSLKSGLATGYEGTTIFGRYYELDELVAHYLQQIRERVEAVVGQAVPELNKPETLHFLRLAQLTSSHPKQIRALESLLLPPNASSFYNPTNYDFAAGATWPSSQYTRIGDQASAVE